MKSIAGFLNTLWLKTRLEKAPMVVRQHVENVEILFAVSNWLEYHLRARDSYTGEPETVAWIKENLKSGDVLWDIGANVGAYSLLAAKLVPDSTVIAFEPYIPSFAHLWENVKINKCFERTTPFCIALSHETDVVKFGISDERAGSSQHRLRSTDHHLHQPVLAMQGDDVLSYLHLQCPSLIKIDVDGYEVEVLHGMKNVLNNRSLRSLLVEVEVGKTEEEVMRLLSSAGFVPQDKTLGIPHGTVYNKIFSRGN